VFFSLALFDQINFFDGIGRDDCTYTVDGIGWVDENCSLEGKFDIVINILGELLYSDGNHRNTKCKMKNASSKIRCCTIDLC